MEKQLIDIQTSTGGFTDVMLQIVLRLSMRMLVLTNLKLRQDERVVSMEQFNFRYAERLILNRTIFASIDVQFYISGSLSFLLFMEFS